MHYITAIDLHPLHPPQKNASIPHLSHVAATKLFLIAHIQDKVRTLVARDGIRRVLHDLRPVMIRIDVVAIVVHALLSILLQRKPRKGWLGRGGRGMFILLFYYPYSEGTTWCVQVNHITYKR